MAYAGCQAHVKARGGAITCKRKASEIHNNHNNVAEGSHVRRVMLKSSYFSIFHWNMMPSDASLPQSSGGERRHVKSDARKVETSTILVYPLLQKVLENRHLGRSF